MEFVLPDPWFYYFAGVIGNDDWIYLIGEKATLEKVNVMTGEVNKLGKLPGPATRYHII